MTETDFSDWLPIADVAKATGKSERTVERRAKEWRLEKGLRPQAGSPPVVVYNPEDVARIAAEVNPAPAPWVLPAVPNPAHGNGRAHGAGGVSIDTDALARLPSDDDPIRQLFAAALRAVLSPPSPPVAVTVAETLFLTIAEAAAVSGLPQADLRRAIEAGELKARKTGRGGWRIRRKDLEAL